MSHKSDSEVERFLRHPVTFTVSAIASVGAVVMAIVSDPTGTVAAIIMTLVNLAMPIFTGASIAGFTLAPEFPQIPAVWFQGVAIVFGVIVVAQIVDQVWDSIKEDVDDK